MTSKTNHLPFRHNLKLSIDDDGGLCGEHQRVVGLAQEAVQHTLQVAGAVAESQERERATLTTQPVHPAAHAYALPAMFGCWRTSLYVF